MLTVQESFLAKQMSETVPLYSKIAALLLQWTNCQKSGNDVGRHRAAYSLSQIMMRAPSGGGIDCGTRLIPFDYDGDRYDTTEYKGGPIKFFVEFHHMNDGGYYDGWTEHTITLRPHLIFGYELTISGKDKNGIKDYLADIYGGWLNESVPRWDEYGETEIK